MLGPFFDGQSEKQSDEDQGGCDDKETQGQKQSIERGRPTRGLQLLGSQRQFTPTQLSQFPLGLLKNPLPLFPPLRIVEPIEAQSCLRSEPRSE